MRLHCWNEIPAEALNPFLTRRMLNTERLTIARLELRQGCEVPRHSHENEQVTTVESGCLRFFFDDSQIDVHPGQSLEIPSGAAHSVTALEDSVALDLFAPRREDWIQGGDSYLRR